MRVSWVMLALAAWVPCVAASDRVELVVNGGFEEGTDGWEARGDFQADARFGSPRSGSGYAYLAAPDGSPANKLAGSLAQTISIPETASSATLSFGYGIVSFHNRSRGPSDLLQVTIHSTTGEPLETIALLFDSGALEGGGYQTRTADLGSYRGGSVELRFEASTDAHDPRIFRLDDVSIMATLEAPATAAPEVQAPDPEALAALEAELRRDWARAAELYREVVGNSPDRIDLWLRISDLEAAAGRPVEAAEALERAVALEPEDAELHARLSRAHASAQNPAAALAAIERALQLDPDNVDHLRAKAQLANWVGEYDQARGAYQRIIELVGEDRAASLRLAETTAWVGELDRAIERYREYLERYPEDDVALLLLARAERWRGNYPGSAKILREYEDRFSVTDAYRVEAGWTLAQAGRPNRALDLLEPVVGDGTGASAVLGATALALSESHRPKLSLLELAKLDPDDPASESLWKAVTTPMRSTIGPNLEGYSDSDSVDRARFELGLDVALSPRFRFDLSGYEAELDADQGSGLESTRVDGEVRVRGGALGVGVRLGPQAFFEGEVGTAEIEDADEDLETYELALDLDLNDGFSVRLESGRDYYAVSPRALDLGIIGRREGVRFLGRPGLRWHLEIAGGSEDFSDGNQRVDGVFSARRAMARTSTFLFDLGLRASWFEFDLDLDNGYYDPASYERYALTMFGYWKLSEDSGLGFTLAPGVFQDDSMTSFELGADLGLELTVGIFRDWQLRLRGSATENSRSSTGAFRGYGGSLQLIRRMTPRFVSRNVPGTAND